MRLQSGSYVDTKGWNLNVGYARRSELTSGALTFGPFIEYGRGSYDSYLDDGTHGNGKTSYIGAGVMAKSESESGTYFVCASVGQRATTAATSPGSRPATTVRAATLQGISALGRRRSS